MFFIGIAGGSGSGKTTFAKKILSRVRSLDKPGSFINEPRVDLAILHQDSYYLPAPPEHLKVHGESNFDHPEAFDWPLLQKHIKLLKEGKKVEVPIYDFRRSRRGEETLSVGPCQAVLLEGIYTLWDTEIRGLFDLRLYLHVEADIRFIRRLHRDVKERGRTIDSIIRQYYDSVRPMHHEYLEPTRQYADIVVGEETDIAADVVAARISEELKEHHS